MSWLWRLVADWCLTYEGGKSVLDGMWLTEGDPVWFSSPEGIRIDGCVLWERS